MKSRKNVEAASSAVFPLIVSKLEMGFDFVNNQNLWRLENEKSKQTNYKQIETNNEKKDLKFLITIHIFSCQTMYEKFLNCRFRIRSQMIQKLFVNFF